MTIGDIKKQFDNTPIDKMELFVKDHKDDERPGVQSLVAKANKKIAESLTDRLIEKAKYDKWNGELPYIEGASTPIVNIKEAEKTE